MRRRLPSALLALFAAPASSHAVGLATQLSCASDYYAYCSQHPVGTPGVRKCMRTNGPRLSKGCINALISDGEISKAEVERTKSKIAADKANARQKNKGEIGQIKANAHAVKPEAAKPEQAMAQRKPPAKAKAEALAKLTDDDPGTPSGSQNLPNPTPKTEEKAINAAPTNSPAPAQPPRPVLILDETTYEALKARQAYFVIEDEGEVPAAAEADFTDDASGGSQRPAETTAAPYTASIGSVGLDQTSPPQDSSASQSRYTSAPGPDDAVGESRNSVPHATQSVMTERDTAPPTSSAPGAEPSSTDDTSATAAPAPTQTEASPPPGTPAPRRMQAQKKPEYPAGKMALGKFETSPPAVRPVPDQSQAWQEFMSNRFSGGLNYEGMGASFSRRGR